MARLPAATRESVPPEQVEEFDRIVETIGRVPPVGPYSALIHAPKALRLADGLNQYLRNESSLSLKTLELAMLVVARELDCQHIWNDHARVARAEGVPDDVITALRDRKPLPSMDDDVAAVINYGQEWFRPQSGARRVSGGPGAIRQPGSGRVDRHHGRLRPACLLGKRLRPRPAAQPHRAAAARVEKRLTTETAEFFIAL